MKRTKYAPIRAPDRYKQTPIKKAVSRCKEHNTAQKSIRSRLDYINFLFYNSKLRKIMKNSLVLIIMVLFMLSACKQEEPVLIESISEDFNVEVRDSRKFPIETKLAEILISGNEKQARSILPNLQGYEDGDNGTNELVIVCYESPYDSGKDCFGVWGTDDCGDIYCEAGCTCTPFVFFW